jgi:hypothetical protein
MIDDYKKGQRARALDALTTQNLKEALSDQSLTSTVEPYQAVVAESLTTRHLEVSLKSGGTTPSNEHDDKPTEKEPTK